MNKWNKGKAGKEAAVATSSSLIVSVHSTAARTLDTGHWPLDTGHAGQSVGGRILPYKTARPGSMIPAAAAAPQFIEL